MCEEGSGYVRGFFLPRFILGFFFLELLLWFLLCLGFLLCFDVLFSGGFGLVGVFCPFSKKAVRLWEVFFLNSEQHVWSYPCLGSNGQRNNTHSTSGK